jgi:AcrR family transcriptional regulator
MPAPRRTALPRPEREALVLDTAQRLFYARGVHEVGMDELVRETGLAKATVYRLFPSKDALVAAYLQRLARTILAAIDRDVAERPDDPAGAIRAIFAAVARDAARPAFRGCPFNNASIGFAAGHPAREEARAYREALRERLGALARRARPERPTLGDELALLVDGVYTSGAHLGPDGPAAAAPALVDHLLAHG